MPGQNPQQEAQCPTCGSPMAKSPAGQQILKQAIAKRAQQGRGGPQRPPMPGGAPMPRPGGMSGPGGPPGASGGIPPQIKAMLLQKMMQARGQGR